MINEISNSPPDWRKQTIFAIQICKLNRCRLAWRSTWRWWAYALSDWKDLGLTRIHNSGFENFETEAISPHTLRKDKQLIERLPSWRRWPGNAGRRIDISRWSREILPDLRPQKDPQRRDPRNRPWRFLLEEMDHLYLTRTLSLPRMAN